MMRGGSCDGRREIVEGDVSTCFDNPPSTEWTRDPDEVSFGIAGIAEETAGFTSWCKFGEGVGDDASGAVGAERA
jgi:hypothetical protein